jgi:hypothetical protein
MRDAAVFECHCIYGRDHQADRRSTAVKPLTPLLIVETRR